MKEKIKFVVGASLYCTRSGYPTAKNKFTSTEMLSFLSGYGYAKN